jgi:RNA polymerase sigma-70 factor (ECF subfamily)
VLSKHTFARRPRRAYGALRAGRKACELERLYADYRPLIVAHCARLLRDSSLAEDATQDVFLRVRRHAAHLPEPSQIRPWLFRVATNHCLNELRNREVRTRCFPELVQIEVLDHEESMSARNDARRLLSRLPPRARAVAYLTYVEGMLQREVAETLGVSRRTVVTHLSEMRLHLQL